MAGTDQLLQRLLLALVVGLPAMVVVVCGDDELGPPISPDEFATAIANSSLKAPPPEGANAIENSGEFEGDIKLTYRQRADLAKGRSAIKSNLWENGEIPYTISSVFTSSERQVIAKAMAEYADKTCIRFIGRTNQKDYIHIVSDGGCYSYIGRTGGMQKLSLDQSGCVYFGIAIHEMMHASGFHHEQSRYDRDNYVIINWDNIKAGKDGNFEKQSKDHTTSLGLKYDYGSVMHYGEHSFSNNGKPTITSKKEGVTLGQRDGFSKIDVMGLNLLYQCKGSDCIDKDENCQGWADDGLCDGEYKEWMSVNCAKACGKCGGGGGGSGECTTIPLSKSNIIDHGGYGNGGAGPEYLLTEDDYWNPNPKPWFVTFDFTKTYRVNKVKIINTGDGTHDVKEFVIESSNDNKQWAEVDVIDGVATDTDKAQYFSISGEGQFWRMSVKKTKGGFQPWIKFFGFCGEIKPAPVKELNLKPIIGVLAQEMGSGMKRVLPDKYKSYIAASYVKFLESGGARVVPIMINQDDSYYEKMAKSLNGIVFPGGSASITSSSGYGRAGRKLYDLVLAAGKEGNPIPLWATCLGFEMLLYLHANGPSKYQVLTKCKASDISIPLDLKDWKDSALLGKAPESVLKPLKNMDITSNFHKYCVLPKTFEKYNLDKDYAVVSTNLDTEGLEFISTVEHKTLPIWGTQWHIEKNAYEWKYKSIPHFPEAIHVGHYFAQFFNDKTRQNNNKFSSSTEERKHLIYNYNPIYLTPFRYSHKYYSSFHQAYFFE